MAISPTKPVPQIRTEEDYEAIRTIPTYDIPHTYEEWRGARAYENLQWAQAGIAVREIEIKPADFATFCATQKIRADFDAIKALAVLIFQRQTDAKT
jgi:hypothetical protein